MNKSATKTTTKQRIAIIIIAILLLISTIGIYVLAALGNSETSKFDEIYAEYQTKSEQLISASQPLSDKYFDEFSKYQSNVKAYNEASATNGVLDTKDLKAGTGRELTEGDTDYMAYYIGWCADGEIFDSSLSMSEEDDTKAIGLLPPISAAGGLIEGWNQGVIGMKLDGVRQITMNGDLAYADTQEICGGYNKPLRFIVMPIAADENLVKLQDELNRLMLEMQLAGVNKQ